MDDVIFITTTACLGEEMYKKSAKWEKKSTNNKYTRALLSKYTLLMRQLSNISHFNW